MKKWMLLQLLAPFALPCLAQSTNAAASGESAQVEAWSQLLVLIGQTLLVVVAVLVALAWIWFPFMVKKRLDRTWALLRCARRKGEPEAAAVAGLALYADLPDMGFYT
jgi:hypothetical protein